jgi:hypothetical protein
LLPNHSEPHNIVVDSPEPRTDLIHARAEVCLLPTPSRRRVDLATIDDVRVEMAKVYREMKSHKIDTQDGTRLVYVLSQIGKMIEANDLHRRIEGLERALAMRGT